MEQPQDRIKKAVDRLIARLKSSRYEINRFGKIVKKIRRNNEKRS